MLQKFLPVIYNYNCYVTAKPVKIRCTFECRAWTLVCNTYIESIAAPWQYYFSVWDCLSYFRELLDLTSMKVSWNFQILTTSCFFRIRYVSLCQALCEVFEREIGCLQGRGFRLLQSQKRVRQYILYLYRKKEQDKIRWHFNGSYVSTFWCFKIFLQQGLSRFFPTFSHWLPIFWYRSTFKSCNTYAQIS